MMAIGNNIEFFTVLRSLIDAWCDRHALKPLSRVLGPYLAFDGLTDGWGEILNALKDVRALCREDNSKAEVETMEALIRAAERALYRD